MLPSVSELRQIAPVNTVLASLSVLDDNHPDWELDSFWVALFEDPKGTQLVPTNLLEFIRKR